MIRLTFVSDTHRGFVDEYDTDDLAEALSLQADRGFRLKPLEEGKPGSDNRGPETWIIAFIVERDEARLTQDEIVATFARISTLECIRGPERRLRPPRPVGSDA